MPIGVAGVGEGGLLALYSAALDPRIQACWVSGYFQAREAIWQEPIYRNVWGLLTDFGDAELAAMIAPRRLMIEACRAVEVAGPPAAREGRAEVAAPGRIVTASTRPRCGRSSSGPRRSTRRSGQRTAIGPRRQRPERRGPRRDRRGGTGLRLGTWDRRRARSPTGGLETRLAASRRSADRPAGRRRARAAAARRVAGPCAEPAPSQSSGSRRDVAAGIRPRSRSGSGRAPDCATGSTKN